MKFNLKRVSRRRIRQRAISEDTVGGLVVELLHSATVAHIFHFQTTNYAEHIALQTYYEEIVKLVDELVESIQGLKMELVRDYPAQVSMTVGNSPLAYLSGIKERVDRARDVVPQEPAVQSSMDQIGVLLNKTLYKLHFLK